MMIAAASARDESSALRWGWLVPSNNDVHVEWHNTGAAFRNGTLWISNENLKRMYFSPHGLAQVFIPEKGWYYVKRDGKSLSVLTLDNGADYFAEGLARSRVNGKIAYFDRNFHLVIPPKYDWGWPFENGKAVVCNGCYETPRDSDGYSQLFGGQWGFIDRQGTEIVPLTLSRDEAWSRRKTK